MVKYEIDQGHTHIGFTAKHLGVSTVRGRFNKFEGQFEGPDDDYTKARGEVKVEVASLESRSDQRDTHLRSADFFDVEKYPYLSLIHISEPTRLGMISYAVFCLKKKKQ